VSLRKHYQQLRSVALLHEDRANQIVLAAKPHARTLLVPAVNLDTDLRVVARLVPPTGARGGSLIPAWPFRNVDGSVTIEFVEDWGVMLAGWRSVLDDATMAPGELDALMASGERLWVGIANDVLQKYVPDPPAGTYSMVRHHALMLGAATLWLGPAAAARWQAAHSSAARVFLRDIQVSAIGNVGLWDAVSAAERGLGTLLADTRAQAAAEDVLSWLEADADARLMYRLYLGAASLGIAALLAQAPTLDNPSAWLQSLIYERHPDPEFNRDWIEAFARTT
jgi:hypothetical protein